MNTISLFQALVCARDPFNNAMTNVPTLCVHHSPTGFEWGYLGSGPSDLAINICEWFLLNILNYSGPRQSLFDGSCFDLSLELHQKLKEDVISRIPYRGGVVPFEVLREWFKTNIEKE
jgi:hypothetical protein